jgi:hypothetical protein
MNVQINLMIITLSAAILLILSRTISIARRLLASRQPVFVAPRRPQRWRTAGDS